MISCVSPQSLCLLIAVPHSPTRSVQYQPTVGLMAAATLTGSSFTGALSTRPHFLSCYRLSLPLALTILLIVAVGIGSSLSIPISTSSTSSTSSTPSVIHTCFNECRRYKTCEEAVTAFESCGWCHHFSTRLSTTTPSPPSSSDAAHLSRVASTATSAHQNNSNNNSAYSTYALCGDEGGPLDVASESLSQTCTRWSYTLSDCYKHSFIDKFLSYDHSSSFVYHPSSITSNTNSILPHPINDHHIHRMMSTREIPVLLGTETSCGLGTSLSLSQWQLYSPVNSTVNSTVNIRPSVNTTLSVNIDLTLKGQAMIESCVPLDSDALTTNTTQSFCQKIIKNSMDCIKMEAQSRVMQLMMDDG